MVELSFDGRDYYYPLLGSPVARVMKFSRFRAYLASLPAGGVVLDYGSGDRPLEPMLLRQFSRYIAADFPASNAGHARRPDIAIVDDRLELASDSVDCVVLTEVLEHIYEPRAALAEIHRVLRPGGALVGTVPFAQKEHEAPWDFHRYTYFCLERMFTGAGFRVGKLEYVGDNVGVAVSALCSVLGILPRAVHRAGLPRVAQLVQSLVRAPEYLYYGAVRIGLDPGRVGYFRAYPFGYAFLLHKPA